MGLAKRTREEGIGPPARPWVIGAALVLVVGLLISSLLAFGQSERASREREEAFGRSASDARDQIDLQLGRIGDLARGVRGFLAVPGVNLRTYGAVAESLDLSDRLGGDMYLAIVDIAGPDELDALITTAAEAGVTLDVQPPGQRDEYRILTYISEAENRPHDIGFDVGTVDEAVAAQDLARETGDPAMTGPIEGVGGSPSRVALYLGTFLGGHEAEGRAERLVHWVVVGLPGDAFLEAAMGGRRDLSVEVVDVTDGDDVVGSWEPEGGPESGFETVRTLEVYGRSWELRFTSLDAYAPGSADRATWVVLIAGAALTLLVFLFLLGLGTSRQLAEATARRATRDLRRREAQFRALFEEAPIGYFLVGEDRSTIVAVNSSFADLVRTTPAQLAERDLRDLVHPEDRATFDAMLERVASGETVSDECECRFLRPDGVERWASVSVAAPDIGGNAGLIGNVEDITERRTRFERLRWVSEFSKTVRSILEVEEVLRESASGIAEALSADRVIVFKAVPEEGLVPLLQWRAPWLDEDLPIPDDISLRLNSTLAAIGLGRVFAIDDIATDPRLLPEVRELAAVADVRAALFVSIDGETAPATIAVLGVGRPRRWTDDEMLLLETAATEVEVALVNANLYERERRMVGELEALDRTKTDFVSTVSHELRTPLTSIRGYIEMLRDGGGGELGPVQARLVDAVERNTGRLMHLIEDLLTLSRVESGTFRNSLGEVVLQDLIDGVIEAMAPTLAGRELVFDISVPEEPTVVAGDALNLERVLFNLIGNAVKFTPDGGHVGVRVSTLDGLAVVAVSDSGIGIPHDEQSKLFTRFFRSTVSRDRQIQGTGLGLAIVKSIVDAHSGTIEVASSPGRGTTVTFTVPLAEEGPGLPASARSAAVRAARIAESSGGDDVAGDAVSGSLPSR